MGAEDDGGAFLLKAQDHILHDIGIDRIQSAEGFIQDDDLWLMNDRCNELKLLFHPLAEGFHLLVSEFFQIQPVKPVINPLFKVFSVIELSMKLEQLSKFHLFI